MTQYTQLHFLTFYPPSNLNRDDLGRPKTAMVGGANRLRVSSQCLKRTWRVSELFQEALAGHLGVRTKGIGSDLVLPILVKAGIEDNKAKDWAGQIAKVFGSVKKGEIDTSQLVHLSPVERSAIETLAHRLGEEKRAPNEEELGLLRKDHHAVDIALFGRMMADKPAYNMEAAAQVAHAFSVNTVALEDDFFTAVDDLNRDDESGAGHVDENWFGSGVFYTYICINRDLLAKNLGDNQELAGKAVRALVEAAARVAPGGKQNSYASRANAGYIVAENGTTEPRNLAIAFMKPVRGEDILDQAVERFRKTRATIDEAYESKPEASLEFYPRGAEGKLSEMLGFVEAGQ